MVRLVPFLPSHSIAHPFVNSPTHSTTHPLSSSRPLFLPHTFNLSPTHPHSPHLPQSLAQIITHSSTHPHTHTHPLTHSSTHTHTHSPTHLLTHPATHSRIYPCLTHPFSVSILAARRCGARLSPVPVQRHGQARPWFPVRRAGRGGEGPDRGHEDLPVYFRSQRWHVDCVPRNERVRDHLPSAKTPRWEKIHLCQYRFFHFYQYWANITPYYQFWANMNFS